jgi:DNA-binding response OmpR family regulator
VATPIEADGRTSSSAGTATVEADRSRILVVDDDDAIRSLLARFLRIEGYLVEEAADGPGAIALLATWSPDLMVLDLTLPSGDGLDVLTETRGTCDVPIILLTARGTEPDRLLGLRLGADDYVVKPFSLTEIAARISSILRRTKGSAGPGLLFDGLSIDVASREVRARGEVVPLTAMEFDLLVCLASSPRQVLRREQLLESVWRSSPAWQDPETVTEHVRRLRSHIEPDPGHPRWILTVRGVGYRFEP